MADALNSGGCFHQLYKHSNMNLNDVQQQVLELSYQTILCHGIVVILNLFSG